MKGSSLKSSEGISGGLAMRRGLSLCAVAAVCWLSLSRGFYEACARDIFFSLSLASVVIVFLHVRPVKELWQAAVVTIALSFLQTLGLGTPLKASVVAGMAGISSLGLLAVRRVWSSSERRTLQYAFLPPLLLILLGYAGSNLLGITGRLHPMTLDRFLYVFDGSLGVQLSFVVGRWVLWSKWLTRLVLVFYYVLPAALMWVYSKQLVRDVNFAMQAFLAFLVAGPLGLIFYNLFPACGPIYLVGSSFPHVPASFQQLKELPIVPVAISGARNAFPSLHLAWALLAWWYSAGAPWLTRAFAALFLFGTAIATLALGEHYFVDLVVALPFALMVNAACRLEVAISQWRRWASIVCGALVLLGWTALLRFAPGLSLISPAVPWTLVAVTFACCGLLLAKLQERQRAEGNRFDLGDEP